MTIWKFQLAVDDGQVIHMPKGARILCVQLQRGVPHLWAVVDEKKPMQPRRIRTIGTGHSFESNSNLAYIGTYQLDGGNLVFHVFEDVM